MEKVIVLDFGGQYTQLIAKKVRESSVFSEVVPYYSTAEEIKKLSPEGIKEIKGIILSGGPASVYEKEAPLPDKKIFELGIPILGICYGMQVLAYSFNGGFINKGVKEFGETEVSLADEKLFSGIKKEGTKVWMSHGDSIDENKIPLDFEIIGRTKNHIAAIKNNSKKFYGVQFHPEVNHTENGQKIIENFLYSICLCKREWSPKNFIQGCKEYIKKTVGKNNVICFVSGGVDSSFVATVLSKTQGIGKVYPIYIEALMRKNETEEVKRSLESAGVKNLIVCKKEDEFIDIIKDKTEPEEKRKAIGNLFGKIQEEMARELNIGVDETFLGQGTLYTDLIESGQGVGKSASNIKSHHNVGCDFIEGLREKNRLVEPNRWIFKDEVRKAAKEIGLPEKIYNREPFPGPGLGIRIVDGKKEWEDEAEGISEEVNEIANKYGLNAQVAPVKTVGVQGDHRTYSLLAVLRGKNEWESIRKAAKEIPRLISKINRVVYEIDSENNKESKTNRKIRSIPTRVTKENIRLLKEIDYKGREILNKHNITLSQTIFILFGADISGYGKRSVALRGVITDDFMTVRPAIAGKEISWEVIKEISRMVREEAGSLVIDVTDKPPATTCWE